MLSVAMEPLTASLGDNWQLSNGEGDLIFHSSNLSPNSTDEIGDFLRSRLFFASLGFLSPNLNLRQSMRYFISKSL
jgi:hypothetical protein